MVRKHGGTSREGLHIPSGTKSEGGSPSRNVGARDRPLHSGSLSQRVLSVPAPASQLFLASLGFSLSLVFRSLCALGNRKPPLLPATHPSPTSGKDPAASRVPAEGIGSVFAKQREEREPAAARNRLRARAPGSALRRAWNPLEARAAHRAGQVSVSLTAPPGRAGISCGGRSYGPEDTPDNGCCRSPDFAHRTASQRRFRRPVHPREGLGDRRKDGGGCTLQWQ